MGLLMQKTILQNYNMHDKSKVIEMLEFLGIERLKNAYFNTLSGGEKQLVLIARALINNPKIILMDEPVNGLDFGNQVKLLEIIKNLSVKQHFIITTHHPRHAKFIGGDSLLIKNKSILNTMESKNLNTQAISNLYDIEYENYKEIL